MYTESSPKAFPQEVVSVKATLSPFLFNFVIDEIMMQTLEGLSQPGVHVIIGEKLVNLEYVDDIVLLFENVQEAQSALDKLTEIVPSFGMRFAPSKCKAMFLDVNSIIIIIIDSITLAISDQCFTAIQPYEEGCT